nr:PcfJ domain-containing protein [Paenibacillus piscarius]
MIELATAPQIKKYLVKQYGKSEVRENYRTGSALFVAWRDYTRECEELGMNLKQDHILFPNNIYRSHQKTMKKIQVKVDEALNGLIAARLPDLEVFKFEKFGLFLRPAASKEELFAEGAALEHCVGSHYTKDYANGKTDIFLIRQTAAPDKPYYTMEVKNGKVLQCEGGKESREKTKLVEEFVNAFVAEKLSPKVKTRKAKSNKPQGVAV